MKNKPTAQGRDATSNEPIHFLTGQEAHDLFDARARYHLRIGGDEYVERWRRDEFDERREDPAVITVAMLMPIVDEATYK